MTESVLSMHAPVLLDEAVAALVIRSDGVYVDATYGRGGHSREILGMLGEQGRLFVVDRDPQAIESARQELGADCMILVRSEGGQWGGASWGRTRERCASLGRVMDGLFDDERLEDRVDVADGEDGDE